MLQQPVVISMLCHAVHVQGQLQGILTRVSTSFPHPRSKHEAETVDCWRQQQLRVLVEQQLMMLIAGNYIDNSQRRRRLGK